MQTTYPGSMGGSVLWGGATPPPPLFPAQAGTARPDPVTNKQKFSIERSATIITDRTFVLWMLDDNNKAGAFSFYFFLPDLLLMEMSAS